MVDRSLRLGVALLSAVLSLLWSCEATTQPIRVGGSLSLTGSYAPLGQTQERGLRLCVKHANENGGVLGRPIRLVIEDDGSSPENAVGIYRRLIVDEGIDALSGPYSSPITDAVAGLTESHQMPTLARDAEFVYGATQWEPQLATTRVGGLIPIAREYPGARRFVEGYEAEFPGKPFSHLSAAAYAGCQILLKAIGRAGTVDGVRVRDEISSMEIDTVYGAFRVDRDGLQVAHRMKWFQWQDGKKVIVWPTELTPGQPRFPTPPWDARP